MPAHFDPPLIAIVVPLFKHSVLVADALASAAGQKCRYPLVIIVVNDGCPFYESDLQVKSIAAALPNQEIRYVLQSNRGLSAARNAGVDYALREFPSVQAVYFMDADNAILPGAIDGAFSKLMAEPETSWVYPNIDMFGIRRHFDYGGEYSVLLHTQHNICEAGSLVHRRVFDAGVRFDEKMNLGYEDWDFWLSAAALGFRGAQHPHFGFRYRNRGESMLSQSKRDDGEIRSFMRRKHGSLLGERSLIQRESLEALRYAIILTDRNEVLLTSGHLSSAELLSQAEFDERLWRNIVIPSRQYLPPFFVLTTQAVVDRLSQQGLLPWALYETELALKEMDISCLVVEETPGDVYEIKMGGKIRDSGILALSRDLVCKCILDVDTSWIERVAAPDAGMKVITRTISFPRRPGVPPPPAGTVIVALLVRMLSWRSSPYRAAADRSWVWREFSIPPPHTLYFNIRALFDNEVVYPSPLAPARNIGFILPIATFSGVERVAYNLARQFAEAGWRVHLFVIGQTRIEIPREFAATFASINLLNDPAFGGWDPDGEYQGTVLPAIRTNSHAINRIVAALAWLDAVVNCHSSEFNTAAARLRKLGVSTAAHVHLHDLSPVGRSVGHPLITLAYEHAYDIVVTNSQQLTAWMHGAGIPREKLICVPNAPGYPLEAETRDQILSQRKSRSQSRVNVLYLGRLDRQKGIERLADVVARTRELELRVDWRIVGSKVAGDYPTPPILREMLEPAVLGSENLTSLFAWADVMVLLSDYEGVPLSVLEAQRLGVVVIATDVGALREIISPGETGFLVSSDSAVDDTVSLLKYFGENPGARLQIALAASRVIEWPEASKELIEKMARLVDSPRDTANRSQGPTVREGPQKAGQVPWGRP